MSDQRHWLVEVEAYDPALPGMRTLYFSNGEGFMTAPTDAPANQFYEPVVKQALNIKRSAFAAQASTSGASRVAFGTVILKNSDDALTPLLAYGFDGQEIRILTCDKVNPTYADFGAPVLIATMEQPELVNEDFQIQIRDDRYQLSVPLQRTKFAGSGLGTLEGDADLKDKPKPVCIGVAKNVPAPCVETAKRIYHVSDKATTVDMVYDRGVKLSYAFPVAAFLSPSAQFFASNDQVLVAWRGSSSSLTSDIRTSTDGITFTAQVTARVLVTWPSCLGMIWSPSLNKFLAFGAASSGANRARLMTGSADGTTWTDISGSLPAGFDQINSACDNGNGTVVLGGLTLTGPAAKIVTTTDGVTFTSRAHGLTSSASVVSVAGNATTLVAAGGTGPDSTHIEYSYSTDAGVTWTRNTIAIESVAASPTPSLRTVACQLRLFVGVTGYGIIVTSADGINWTYNRVTVDTAIGGAGSRMSISTVRKKHYILAIDVQSITYVSDDGGSWAPVDLGAAVRNNAFGIWEYNDEVFVAAFGASFYKSAGATTYASQADLLDNTKAPRPGTFKYWSDATGTYFRLGQEPDGLITADVTEGATAADRTTAQVLKRLFARETLTIDAGDVAALDVLNSAEVGFWSDEEQTLATAADEIAGSAGAGWFVDAASAFRVKRLDGPAALTDIDLTADDLAGPPARRAAADPGRGIPIYKSTVRYAKNYTVQASDIADATSAAHRAFMANEWRTQSAQDLSVLTAHLLAQELVEDTLLATSAAAATEATRRLALRGRRRDRIDLTVLDMTAETLAIDLFKTVGLTHTRVGGTHRYLVIGIEVDAVNDRLLWTTWGPE